MEKGGKEIKKRGKGVKRGIRRERRGVRGCEEIVKKPKIMNYEVVKGENRKRIERKKMRGNSYSDKEKGEIRKR